MLNQLTKFVFFDEADPFTLARANNIQTITRHDAEFFTGISRSM